MKYFVYRNLHKPGHTYSIKALEGPHKGRVVAYGQSILIKDVRFVVKEAGRRRVLATGRKNVHAGIIGDVVEVYNLEERLPNQIPSGPAYVSLKEPFKLINYNPYKAPTFYDIKTNEPVHNAGLVGIYGSTVEAYRLTT